MKPIDQWIAGASSGGKGGYHEADDSLFSRGLLSVIDLLGEGQIGGLVNGAQSIYFDGTSLANADGTLNFEGVSWEFKPGTADQSPLKGFSGAETPYSVGKKIRHDLARVITVADDEVDRVRMILMWPTLTKQSANGDSLDGTSVSYKFQISRTLSDGTQVAFEDWYGNVKYVDGGTVSVSDTPVVKDYSYTVVDDDGWEQEIPGRYTIIKRTITNTRVGENNARTGVSLGVNAILDGADNPRGKGGSVTVRAEKLVNGVWVDTGVEKTLTLEWEAPSTGESESSDSSWDGIGSGEDDSGYNDNGGWSDEGNDGGSSNNDSGSSPGDGGNTSDGGSDPGGDVG